MAKGADVIFSTGSPTGDGALLAACKAGVLAIGSDTDQAAEPAEAADALPRLERDEERRQAP